MRVIVPDTGSGYGGKHTGDAAVEAARLASAAGKPVKLVWTREEEFTWAYFRPAGVIDITATAQADGTLTQWEYDNYNSGASGVRAPYEVPSQRAEFHRAQSPLREGSYRGLASTANHFARESHMDDLARMVKMDPLAFRLKNLKDARLCAALQAAAARFGWDKRKATPGHGFGLACGLEKGSYVARCVELMVDRTSGKVQMTRIVTAFECGAIVNPTHLQNQVEGARCTGIGRRAVRGHPFRQRENCQSPLRAISPAPVRRCAAHRGRSARPQRPALRRRGRNAHRRHCPGHSQRHFGRYRPKTNGDAARSQWPEGMTNCH